MSKEKIRNLENRVTRLAAQNSLLTEQLVEKETRLAAETAKNAVLSKDLETVQSHVKWLHTAMKLRGKLERCEQVMRPKEGKDAVTFEIWEDTPRTEKWDNHFFRLGTEGYGDFVSCVEAAISDRSMLGKRIHIMYSVLNARVHRYFETKEITEDFFTDADLKKIADCLNNFEI